MLRLGVLGRRFGWRIMVGEEVHDIYLCLIVGETIL
jgi:hypothetical protein